MENTPRKKIKVCCVVSVDMTLKFMLFSQLKFLRSQGYEVHAVCSPGKWVKDIEKEGIKVKTIKITRKMISPVSDLMAFLKLFFYFKKEKFDIIHVHTPKAEIYGQFAAYLAGVPIILNTLHGFDLPAGVPIWERKLFMCLERIVGKCSSLVFSISYDIIKKVKKHKIFPPDIIKYLGRDIDTERFDPKRFSGKFIKAKKKELNIADDKKVIGIVARMVAEKGYIELFEAFSNVILKFPNAVIVVIGQQEPDKKDAIKSGVVKQYGIENNVIFLGERKDTEELYPLMDIFVLPTHREGLGAVILEASGMEIPVIATNEGGCPEAVEDGRTGILVPVKDVKSLAKAITFLLENPHKAREMGKNGRKKIVKEFNKNIVLERLKYYYEMIIEKKLESDFEITWKKRFDSAAKESEGKEVINLGLTSNSKYYYDYFLIYLKENKFFSKVKSVLDAGCGMGEFTKILVQGGLFVTAVDYSEEVIAFAKKKSSSPNARFLTADIYNLPFSENTYDMAICIAVLQHLKNPQKAISEVVRTLKPGGIFVIITLNPFSIDAPFQKENVIRYSPFWVRGQFKKLGFERIKIKGIFFSPKPFNFITDIIIKFKIYKFLNALFPFFCVVSHAYYIEGVKKDDKTKH